MSDWVKETLHQRLEYLKEQVELLPEIATLQNKRKALERALQLEFEQRGSGLHMEWLDAHAELALVKIGWFYAKGVQDGLKMLIFLQNSEEELEKTMTTIMKS
ncbi:hypothetical protein WJ0W_000173 [Paenibacillus melissococcoides]|uniref:Uncharacterized protein n=1 Tax=Paenibacillus melissococcoides TaxID=2912268 RepID=A0ABM9FV07_9BACL|nr:MULTISPECIES: hypothetical protein [Paenibacillus]MEB9896983.1 hypothetical protein [Bacillus cereus]CAH8242964.1 hypothetical protein WJ0W_000173 [Paenibacillus melissococcoides]CAH8703484.1 hypothetical protein WDD9_000170 [Paenibacillus melissococcoides]CAH8706387.1 hypothetical protein HTL2_001254 [Paenibacillus melissococcoides]GIO80096.1 hypothetical protein J6TS7_37060 [Paenibacillus dendritiformis]